MYKVQINEGGKPVVCSTPEEVKEVVKVFRYLIGKGIAVVPFQDIKAGVSSPIIVGSLRTGLALAELLAPEGEVHYTEAEIIRLNSRYTPVEAGAITHARRILSGDYKAITEERKAAAAATLKKAEEAGLM